jgi:hypothetical protein
MLTLDDLFELAAPQGEPIEAAARAQVGDAPLGILELLELGYGVLKVDVDEATEEALHEWFQLARYRGLKRICDQDPAAARAWVRAAARDAWAQWAPVLKAADGHDYGRVEAQIKVALDPASTPGDLAAARRDTSKLPKRGPPPPYVGHFYGGLAAILEDDLPEAVSFFCVPPNGDSRSAIIAALYLAAPAAT